MSDDVDELFALPPSEFTAARNALVKRLRAGQRRDEAEAVKSLRRPSVPAWAVNQLARRDPEAVSRVLAAGADVVAAQRRALSGVREAGLREASQRRREVVDDVWRIAAAILRDGGIDPQQHRHAVTATLEAASVDADAAGAVRAGRLERDLPAPSGFGDVAGFSLVTPSVEGTGGEADTDDEGVDDAAEARGAAADAAALKAQQVRRHADELADRAAEARRSAVRSGDEAQRLAGRAAQARQRADDDAARAQQLAERAEAAAHQAEEAEAAAATADSAR